MGGRRIFCLRFSARRWSRASKSKETSTTVSHVLNPVTVTFDTRQEARDWAAGVEALMSQNRYVVDKDSRIAVSR